MGSDDEDRYICARRGRGPLRMDEMVKLNNNDGWRLAEVGCG